MCLRQLIDDETSPGSESRCDVVSTVDPLFALLSSSVDIAHCRVVYTVTADFIRLLSRLVATADIDFTVKVLLFRLFWSQLSLSYCF